MSPNATGELTLERVFSPVQSTNPTLCCFRITCGKMFHSRIHYSRQDQYDSHLRKHTCTWRSMMRFNGLTGDSNVSVHTLCKFLTIGLLPVNQQKASTHIVVKGWGIQSNIRKYYFVERVFSPVQSTNPVQ